MRVLSLWALLLCLSLLPTARAGSVLVFAASSTTNAIEEVNALYAEAGHGKAQAAFGSSGMLSRQIENGAPADVFITADESWLEYLARQGLVRRAGVVELCRNRLVLVAPLGSPLRLRIRYGFPLAEKLGDAPLAIADPGHSPAGRYAKAALTTLGVWDAVAARTARAGNVREALALVERGEAAAGIVYATDAAISRRVRRVAVFPEATHPAIRYRAAIVAGRESPSTRRYFAFLTSPPVAEVLRRHGFIVE